MPGPPIFDGARAGRAEGRRAIAVVVFVLGSIVLGNLIATRLSSRLDLTEDHVYTLSPASRELVRSLPDELTVKAYISRELPPAQDAVGRFTRGLLEEYRLASEGQLRFLVQDPTANPRIEAQARRCRGGETAAEDPHAARPTTSQQAFTLGLCLWYDGHSRALALIDGAAGLEYRISTLIKAMSQRRRKVGFTTGHGEHDPGRDYSFVRRALARELDVVTLDPSRDAIGDDIDLLVVAGPRRPFDDRARRAIDAFLMKGRPALFLVDGAALDAPRAGEAPLHRGRSVDSGLDPLLAAYGFRIERTLVFDRLSVAGPVDPVDLVSVQEGPVLIKLPAFVATRPERALISELSITTGVDTVVFPFVSAVELVGPLARGDAGAGRVWTLARTSPAAWRQTGPFPLSVPTPTPTPAPTPAAAPVVAASATEPPEVPPATATFALAYAYRGTLTGAYPAEVPLVRPAAIMPGGAIAPGPPRSARPVRLVVVAGSEFVSDRYLQLLPGVAPYAGGVRLLRNAIEWALEDDALTTLRANVLKARPLRIDPAGEGGGADLVALLTWGNVVGLPLAVCAAGLLRWRWRSTTRRRLTLSDPRGPES